MHSCLPAVADASRTCVVPGRGDSCGDGRGAGRWPAGSRRGDGHGGGCGAVGGRAGGVLPAGGDGPGRGPPGRDACWRTAGCRICVRLGELERHLGDGVIEAIADAAIAKGRLRKRERRRIMSYPLVIRLMIAMTLMPDGSYCESLARLAGLLADVPFALEWHVPTEKVVTDWRVLVPADVMESVFWEAAGPLIGDGEPSAVLLAGMTVCAADGMLVNLADTPENRAMFGCTGTAAQDGEGAAPFPQLRIVALTARAGRAMLGAILGSTPGRGADPAETARATPPGPVRRPRDLLRSQLSRS